MADNNIQHEDFGEKIGGAKKDLWKDRGLNVNDLDAMNERESEKFVKKDNIWKKPDYTAMLDDGIPLGVVRSEERRVGKECLQECSSGWGRGG